ncbi:glutathione gamma-glutamylcysteinyltransferase 1 isoform X2 [Elaeis guineensis]|uniref:glutathione gamma-glutamylcysteinyltransferase n=3 Tax=Elaeis guineensis var. tenera TaxID=51953 RepID=A0A6I9SI03_ELAGV|nr:glutathione gamma-glutamylcysteinyltransferase 1 isoform X1 [Elaeis guineensis]
MDAYINLFFSSNRAATFDRRKRGAVSVKSKKGQRWGGSASSHSTSKKTSKFFGKRSTAKVIWWYSKSHKRIRRVREMAVAGVYRRALPSPPAIEFPSPGGKQLFAEALQSGNVAGFFKLISYFQTQSEPAYCGLASLSMVLNALAIDPGRKWKGPWRWFDESMLDCCEPLEKIKAEGTTFGKVICLAQCAGAKVEAFRTNQSTINDFRNHVIKCTNSEDCHLITSYHRKILKQTGSGHFSPIGAYHAGSDMVLILDVARFKYPPHWVPLSLLWQAMDTIDEVTGYRRGYMLISRPQEAPSLLYTLNCRQESWLSATKYFIDDVPLLLKSEDLKTVPQVLSLLFQHLPANAGDFITWITEVRRREEDGSNLSEEEKGRLAIKERVLQEVRETKLFKFVTEWLFSVSSCCRNEPSVCDKDSLPDIAASVYYQGAELLNSRDGANQEFCCRGTSIKCLRATEDLPMTLVSGKVVSGGREQLLEVLAPVSPANSSSSGSGLCNSTGSHPTTNDLLTVLLLALPSHTWLGIKDERLLTKIQDIFSTENLPDVLQEEVLHLRRQLQFLRRCKDRG